MPPGIKALALRVLAPSVRRAIRDTWEDWRDWFDATIFGLHFLAASKPRPRLLLLFGFALGDDLLCTAVLRELRTRGTDGLLMVSDHQGLFTGNTDPAYVRPLWRRYYRYISSESICRRFTRMWGGEYVRLEYAPLVDSDRRMSPQRHIVAEMCARAGVTGPVAIRPYLTLQDAEIAAAAWARDRIVIQSSGQSARHPAMNKEWFAERFQVVVDALRQEFEFVQLGSAEDPPLRDVLDLRGRTNLRESAAVLHHARLNVGLEGFIMHLARAVECPSVIVFGGRAAPWQLGYVCNLNLASHLPCAPCWRTSACEFDRQCMRDITPADVVAAIRQMLARPRGPLAVETIDIAPIANP